MNTANNKKPGSLNTRQQVNAQTRNASQGGPLAPPVYKPQPPKRFVQRKIAGVSGNAAVVSRPAIQLAKGNAGGKGGAGYSSVGGAYSEADLSKAMQAVGISGVKGHGKGKPGSKESSQTKHEMAAVVEVLRENKAKEHAVAQGCRVHHKRNRIGDDCPSCGREITAEMCK